MAKLSPKQQRFVEEYLVDLNGTQAAIRAGYSEKTAAVIATENLRKPNIQVLIQEAKQKLSEKVGITQEFVIEGLRKEAEREGDGASHSARVSAYGLLGKHLGMFKDQVELSTKEDAPIVVQLAMPNNGTRNQAD